MKSVLISIQPKWVEKIASGQKTIEVRKTRPKLETLFKCYIYCTKGFKFKDFKYSNNFLENYNRQGKVIGEFVCDRIDKYKFNWAEFTAYGNKTYLITETQLKNTCLSREDFDAYGCAKNGHSEKLYGWHISDLIIYDKPKELSEFCKPCNDSYDPMYGSYCIYCDKRNKITSPPQSWCYVEVE